tara:strand:- start:430 stop:693 length:264 start_codon:yes stop_codon:yes gene_type:complete
MYKRRRTIFRSKPIISVLIFNCRDVKWVELDGEYTIHNLLYLLHNEYDLQNCMLEINNINIDIKKESNIKLKYYITEYNSLTIKIFY